VCHETKSTQMQIATICRIMIRTSKRGEPVNPRRVSASHCDYGALPRKVSSEAATGRGLPNLVQKPA
jgi:hypothetical protein